MSKLPVWMSRQSVKFRKNDGGGSNATDFLNRVFLDHGIFIFLVLLKYLATLIFRRVIGIFKKYLEFLLQPPF